MSKPVICPICRLGPAIPLFESVQLTADIQGVRKVTGGLAAFQCAPYAHVFFVRQADIVDPDRKAASSSA